MKMQKIVRIEKKSDKIDKGRPIVYSISRVWYDHNMV